MQTSDIIVVGAGIAGSSAAAELAREARVCLLEMEAQPGYHATGRSAAYFATSYGKQVIRDFTASCENFLLDPPDGFTEVPLLTPRDYMVFGREDQAASLRAEQESNPALEFLDPDAVRRRVPIFAEGYLHGALWDRRGGDLDVDALLQAYLRLFRRREGLLFKQHRVNEIRRRGDCWRLTAAGETFEAPVIVNAAGAWVEEVAGLAGLSGLGIQPLRRTALTIPAPAGVETADWPEMFDVDEEFYFKPDAGQILISPADETPCAPADVQPDDIDVATGVYRFEQATGLDIRRVNHSWAGLRTFAPDRVFVAGFDPRAEGYYWLAGQGGYGVMTAPAVAFLTSHLVNGSRMPEDFSGLLEYVSSVAPDRLIS
jgi:D-arginine dehydrogenase